MKYSQLSPALRIALAYALFGGIWIIVSDTLLASLVADEADLVRLAIYKGWLYVIVSSVLIFFLLRRELAARRVAEERVSESEERFRSFMEQSSDGLMVANEQGIIIEWNPALTNITGLEKGQALGMTLWELQFKMMPPERRSKIKLEDLKKSLMGMLQDGHSPFFGRINDAEIQTVQEERKFIQQTSFLIPTSRGYFIGGIVRDVTGRKRDEEALRESEEKSKLFIQYAPAAIAMFDRQMRYVAVSRRWISDFHLTENNILGKSHYEIFPEITDELKEIHQRGLSGEVVKSDGDKFERADGSIQWLRWEMRPWNAAGGSIGGIVIFSEDITGRKQAEEELRESETRYRYLFETNPHPMWIYDLKSLAFLAVNDAAIAKYGYTRQEFQSMTIADIRPSEELQRLMENLAAPRKTLEYSEGWRHRLKDGRLIDVAISSHTINLDQCDAVLVVAQDITERKQAEQQVNLQLRRLRALNEIDRAINSSMDMRISLDILLDRVRSQLGVDAAAVLLFNAAFQNLEYTAGKGFKDQSICDTHVRLGDGLAGRVGLDRKVLHVPDLVAAAGQFQRAELLKDEKFVEYFGVPLISKGKLEGVLEIFHRAPLAPDLEWMNYLETLGEQAAIAIDNMQLFKSTQQSNMELVMAYDATIEGWSRAMNLRDKETEGHTQRVTDLTLKLAREMDIPSDQLVHYRRGALLHDIGKIGVPDGILLKEGPLTDEEWLLMRRHPELARDMLAPIHYLTGVARDIPYCHHEKWDGTGYPRGLKGMQIPLAARIFAVVDAWDALRSDRLYREKWPEKKVLKHIRSLAGRHFDPQAVAAFLKMTGGR